MRDQVVRWVLVDGLPDLPLGMLDVAYSSQRCDLTVSAYFSDVSRHFPQFEPPEAGIVLKFTAVEAFKAYEEFTDPMYAEQWSVPLLQEAVPYGGTWGFLEVLNSSWIARLADRNLGWDRQSGRHYVVKSADLILHVANMPSHVLPTFEGWISK